MIKEFLTYKGLRQNILLFEDYQGNPKGFLEYKNHLIEEYKLLDKKSINKSFFVKYFSKNKAGEQILVLNDIIHSD